VRVLYLHGFASSAQSSKALMLAEKLAPYGIRVEAPDFNLPSFETLTVTRMIDQTISAQATGEGPAPEKVALIGSSLGAFVAVHVAAQCCNAGHLSIDRLVLLAPALDFGANRMRDLGEQGIDQWRRTGRLDVFHHAYERTMPVGYALYEDAARYDAFALDLQMPILIFQGARDTVVDPEVATRFARGRQNVTVRMLDDDHQLLQSMPTIWAETRGFFHLPPPS
jgi:pimeloyl-ACP methyl ester carboxylesterase